MKTFNIVTVSSATLFILVSSQFVSDSASSALNQFALKFLAETNNQASDTYNLALSPYTVWSVLAIINEGARRNTEKQLENTLGIPQRGPLRDQFRRLQRALSQNLLKNTDGITLEVVNALFTRLEKRINKDYQELVQQNYNTEVNSLDFNNAHNASKYINKKLADATRGIIDNIVKDEDLPGAQMFITSALFFKGIWEKKFNASETKQQSFYNEQMQPIGKVQMMYNKAPFRYTQILKMKAEVVELPYKDEKMSMVVILPTKPNNLRSVLNVLANSSFSSILDALTKSAEYFANENVNVYLPKFKIISDLNLNYVLHRLGIQDAFSAAVADLTGISPDEMFLSRIIHKAEIDVDENGTVASSITVGELENKIPPPDFVANRPFIFFIYDKITQSIVFMGKYSFPM